MEQIHICNLNVRGIGELRKHRQVFNYLKQANYNIICLQETHSDESSKQLWKKQWHNGEIFFSHGETNSRGVCILFNKLVLDNVVVKYKDNKGRILILQCEIGDNQLTLANIYAPNKDDPNFFCEVFKQLDKCDFQDKILVGDFNMVMNVGLDCKGSDYYHHAAVRVLQN